MFTGEVNRGKRIWGCWDCLGDDTSVAAGCADPDEMVAPGKFNITSGEAVNNNIDTGRNIADDNAAI